ncbi:MAG: glycosyltransferase family 39 protein [Saprospiraceae bacterium]|nr:glycosyltransferase family 39 protein [Saprospiraceae bacterium]
MRPMRRDYLLLSGLALLFFFPFLGSVHLFDWDEINFAECAREMLLTGDWMRPQIDFEPFWEKPPLFLWMQALSMKVFGINEFAARFPNAICGWATLLLVYHIGYRIHDRLFGWIWALGWLGSLLPHMYFRSGIIDPWFNFFIFAGLYGFIEFRWRFFKQTKDQSFWVRYRHLLGGGAILGLAILTKGPTAFLIVGLVLVAYWAKYRFKGKGYFFHLVYFSLAAGIAAMLWFGVEYWMHGPWFLQEFITYQIRLLSTEDSGHGGFLGYHFVVLLLGCFPMSVFAISNLWGDSECEDEALETNTMLSCVRYDFGTWMQLLFWVVLILFSLVKTKIVHYSSLCYFPLTYLGSVTLWRAVKWGVFPRITKVLLPIIGIILGLAVAALPYLGNHLDLLRPLFQKDPFALANLEADVTWEWWQGIPGIVLLFSSIVGAYLWARRNAWAATQTVLAGGAIFTGGTLLFVVCNIEGYSQRAAIEFYEAKASHDCIIKPVGFKSYAHLFYGNKQDPGPDKTVDDLPGMYYKKPPKPTYFIAKINRINPLQDFSHIHEIGRKNGFVFFEWDPAAPVQNK